MLYPKPTVAPVPVAHGSAWSNEIAVTIPVELTVAIPTAVWIPPDERKESLIVIVGAVIYPSPEWPIDTDDANNLVVPPVPTVANPTVARPVIPVGAENVTVGAIV